jgi:HSP20 family protein
MSVPIKKLHETPKKSAVKKDKREAVPEISHHPLFALRQEIDRLFDDMFPISHASPFRRWGMDWPRWPRMMHEMAEFTALPRSDISETDKHYIIRAELPGLSEDELEITVSDDILTLKGEKRAEHDENKADYHLSECSYGMVQRSFPLPKGVDMDKVKAEFDKGVLKVTFMKTKEATPRKISVKARGKVK